jgi:DNA-binding transcriptional regulator YdaS (Cro superfamily)
MKKTILQKTADRLSASPEGTVLLDLINRAGNPNELARKIGVHAQLVRQWIYEGKVSRQGAPKVALAFNTTQEAIRPDVDPAEWIKKPVEQKAARVPVARSDDAKFLVRLAKKHGSVKAVCEKASCTVADYHTWKTRGRIPAIKLPAFLALI